jgi:hypothetical protein
MTMILMEACVAVRILVCWYMYGLPVAEFFTIHRIVRNFDRLIDLACVVSV